MSFLSTRITDLDYGKEILTSNCWSQGPCLPSLGKHRLGVNGEFRRKGFRRCKSLQEKEILISLGMQKTQAGMPDRAWIGTWPGSRETKDPGWLTDQRTQWPQGWRWWWGAWSGGEGKPGWPVVLPSHLAKLGAQSKPQIRAEWTGCALRPRFCGFGHS